MLTELRRQADDAAQQALRALTAWIVRHPGARYPDPLLSEAYWAAERVVDAVADLEHLLEDIEQRDDPQGPVYADGWTEADMAFAHGDR